MLLSGCGALGPLGGVTASDESAARQDLATGVAQYERGEFVGAIRTLLSSQPIWRGPVATRVEAHKVVAFSQCVLGRQAPCRESFAALLQLDPGFKLSAAEAGHPQWGTAFRQARRQASAGTAADASAPSSPRTIASRTAP